MIFGLMLSTSLILFSPYAAGRDTQSFTPKEGFLPDEATAIAVAEIILIKIYGVNQIKEQRPFSANLNGDIWDIKGSLSPQEVGGTAHIRIKKNGEIIQLSHSR
ncbi:NTF2 fold immunity protein [Acidovorax sp. Leaf78]|uniref:NTF2 fold immunity protein n=1 Tax=unclassified Acidovorax TaxID=2684926 RepID=UPI0009ECAB8A|nr:NTF2 fold immunity protein [Acidovorax sp. Leaf78]